MYITKGIQIKMWNLIKYEIQGRSKLIIGGIIAFTIANLMLMSNYVFRNPQNIGHDDKYIVISIIFMALLSLIGIIVIIVDSVNLMKKDLFTDTGYLLFSIPQKGATILGSKLIVSLIEFILYGFFTVGFFFIHAFIFSSIHSSDSIRELINIGLPTLLENISTIIIVLLQMFVSIIAFILTIYLALTIAKSLMHSKKHSGFISFIIFVVLQIIISKLSDLINSFFGISATSVAELSKYSYVSLSFQLILCVVIFASTAYLIDNKVEM